MGFHLSPADPFVRQMFTGNLAALERARIPISARAGLLRLTSSPAASRLQVKRINDARQKSIETVVMPHLARAFGTSAIKLEISRCEGGLSFFAMGAPLEMGNAFFSRLRGNIPLLGLLSLDMIEGDRRVKMRGLDSRGNGLGGRLVAATYNIAADMGYPEIVFEVRHDDFPAKCFYFHTDFGTPGPIPPRPKQKSICWSETWRVNVRQPAPSRI